MRWIYLIAPMGALFYGCAADGTSSDGSQTYTNDVEDTPPTPSVSTEDLMGDYADCNAALIGLGFTPWVDFTKYQDAAEFYVYITDDDGEDIRPWVATLSFDDSELGYHITCGDTKNSAVQMWVDPTQTEYWSCLFQADQIGIEDPESDPECSKDISGGDRAVSEDSDWEEFSLAAPGHLVLDEE